MAGKTLYDKLWESHLISEDKEGAALIYIDRHFVHEVTSAQPFEGLRLANRRVWRPKSIVSTADHNTPTQGWQQGIQDSLSREQVAALDRNAKEFRFGYYFPFMGDKRQGIVHVVGPEQGASLPGMSIVCGDSHTSTHGAFATLAQGIGISEVEHVLATQCFNTRRSKTMRIEVRGRLPPAVTVKDLALFLIRSLGTAGGTGYVIEFTGEVIRALSMEERMTLCNLAIEAGSRLGLVAVDDTTLEYLKGRPLAPTGENWEKAVEYWRTLVSDEDAQFDASYQFSATHLQPQATWGTSPEMVININDRIPNPQEEVNPVKRQAYEEALAYMGLKANTPLENIPVDVVFIGSCTNGRLEDLRQAAQIVRGHKKASSVNRVLVVPGSGLVKEAAEKEGLDHIFKEAGFEWRQPGCSMCLAMNDDKLLPYERCASTSNRNFEGRQGRLGRTHLLSPSSAAAAAIAGHFIDPRKLGGKYAHF